MRVTLFFLCFLWLMFIVEIETSIQFEVKLTWLKTKNTWVMTISIGKFNLLPKWAATSEYLKPLICISGLDITWLIVHHTGAIAMRGVLTRKNLWKVDKNEMQQTVPQGISKKGFNIFATNWKHTTTGSQHKGYHILQVIKIFFFYFKKCRRCGKQVIYTSFLTTLCWVNQRMDKFAVSTN